MRTILHYTIGLPPARSGGSVQYAYDLMREQVKQGYKVYTLICGDTLVRVGKTKIKRKTSQDDLSIFTLTNPLTPTLIYGVANPESQYRPLSIDYENIRAFVVMNGIEIMHIHTFQGLHKEIVSFIKSLGVKIIYTTHDFHGICPHYNLIDFEGKLCKEASPGRCIQCNRAEPSDKFLRLANSSLYHYLKSKGFKKKSSSSSDIVRISSESEYNPPKKKVEGFRKLLDYYRDYFHLIDKFHFNSVQTKEQFTLFLGNLNGDVIPVLTRGITDKRKAISSSNNIITFGYIGNLKEYKGFSILKKVLLELYEEGYKNFRLKVYGSGIEGADQDCNNIQYLPPYNYSDISKILYGLDATIVPSKWYETFSLVTLESLSHGRPAIVSSHVGAKDIVHVYSPELIFDTENQLKVILKDFLLSPQKLTEINKKILSAKWRYDFQHHVQELEKIYE